MIKINVLGTEYEIILSIDKDNAKLKEADGICEAYTKKLVINDFDPDNTHFDNIEDYKKKVIRHEIVHAFLHESGLDGSSDWARNEEMVDWMAFQIPKIWRAFIEAECI